MFKGEKSLRNFKEEYSLVRFLHAVPNGETVDVYVNGVPFFNELDFTKFTPYVYMPKWTYIVEVYSEDTVENPLVKQEIDIKNDELLTIAIIVDDGKVKLLPIKEDKELAPGKQSKIRFVHLVPNGRDVNITLGGKKVFENVKYMDATKYELLDPGEYDLDIEVSINNDIIDSSQIKINPNRIYTFYAIGEAPNFELLQSLDGATFLI